MEDDPALGEALTTVVTIGAEMNRRVVSINDHVNGMSRLAEAAIAELGSVVTATGEADLMAQLGRDLEDAADRFAVDVDALEGAVAAIDEAMTVVLRAADALGRPDQPERAEANHVLTSFAWFADPAAQGAVGFQVFENVLAEAEAAPEPLRGACRRLRGQLRQAIACYERIDGWGSTAAELLVPPDATTL